MFACFLFPQSARTLDEATLSGWRVDQGLWSSGVRQLPIRMHFWTRHPLLKRFDDMAETEDCQLTGLQKLNVGATNWLCELTQLDFSTFGIIN